MIAPHWGATLAIRTGIVYFACLRVFLVYVRDEDYFHLLPPADGEAGPDARVRAMAFPPLGIQTLAPILRRAGHTVRMFDTCHPRMRAAAAVNPGMSFPGDKVPDIGPEDRVFIANEDSNTITVIDPRTNTVETTINLTSFDEDPRPPFRFVTGGVTPTHAAMIHKPLYHGCIDAHGVVPSPDGTMLATSGRGSSNVYLIDTRTKKVIGNTRNPFSGPNTNPERLSSGIIVDGPRTA